jgi:hypothetical protein
VNSKSVIGLLFENEVPAAVPLRAKIRFVKKPAR